MFLRKLRGVLIRVDHVLDFGGASVPIHVITDKTNAVPPSPVIRSNFTHTASIHDFRTGVAHVRDNFVDHSVCLGFGLARDSPHTNGQLIPDALPILVLQEPEVIIADVASVRAHGIFTLVGNDVRGGLQVDTVGIGAVSEKLQVLRGLPTAIQSAVAKHHHQHLDGRWVNAATRKFIKHRALRRHQNFQTIIRMECSEPLGGFQENGTGHDHKVSTFDGMQVGRRNEAREGRFRQ